MKHNRVKSIVFLALIFLAVAGPGRGVFRDTAFAQVQDVFDSKETPDIYLYRGDLVSVKVYSLTRIAIGTPGIVDIKELDVDELVLIGQQVGETPIYIWDEFGKRKIMARVMEDDLDLVIERITKLLKAAEIDGITFEKNHFERKIVATGKIVKQKKEELDEILRPFGGVLINMVREDEDLIQIDVQITELSTTLQKAFGIDWNTGALGVTLKYEEQLPAFDGSLGDLFKIGDFKRTTKILAIVDALITEGEARVLSKPSIVVTSGEAATFLVGGEIPVRTTTVSAGGTTTQDNITYTSYGVNVRVIPEIKNDKINIDLNVNIRDIDASNAVAENVAFTTRTANTKLLLNDGQTIVLAGLIKQNTAQTIKGVPYLRRIPILGILFRHHNWPTDIDQEVVISLTPRIIAQKKIKAAEEKESSAGEKAPPAEETKEEEWPAVPEEMAQEQEYPEQAAEEIPVVAEAEAAGEITDIQAEVTKQPAEEATQGPSPSKIMGYNKPGEQVAEAAEVPAAEEAVVPPKQEEAGIGKNRQVSQAISLYAQTIQDKISRAITFPRQAKTNGWEGTVVLSLTILSDGTLNDVKVKESSGRAVFDKDAVNTARILAPFDPFPPEIELEELVVTIPVVYSPEAVLEGDVQP